MRSTQFYTELNHFKELASLFSAANPALAPLLSSPMTDPDVERFLEAIAYQNGLLFKKLEVDFSELIQKLAQLILPHFQRPVPSRTIIAFSPQPISTQSQTIPAGTQLASVPVEGTVCRFTTTSDLEIHPVELTDVVIVATSAHAAEIRLSFSLCGLSVSRWQPEKLRLFLGGDYAFAAELYLCLCRHVTRIVIETSEGSAKVVLPSGYLQPAGFGENEGLLPIPPQAFPGYLLLLEYFNFPEKFLFFELYGWEYWQNRGDGEQFIVRIELDGLTAGLPRVGRNSFVLHAVPAVNLFPHDADPIFVDHRASCYRVRPSGSVPFHYQIYSIDGVTGFSRDSGRERIFEAFELFSTECSGSPVYHTALEKTSVHGVCDVFFSLAFPDDGSAHEAETISISLTCSNGTLPGDLHIGDIRDPVYPFPESVAFRNITAVHAYVQPCLSSELLWQLSCHLYLNHVSLASVENFRALLNLYVFPEKLSAALHTANLKRIAGIEDVSVVPDECLVAGIPMRGRQIRLTAREDHFAGAGDLYLFGCILDHFLAGYASINTFTQLVLIEMTRGVSYQWPIRQE